MNGPGPQSAAGPAAVSNTITGGVFFGAVVQGRDIQVTLPAEITPAMTGLPRPAAVFTGRDDQLEDLLARLSPDGEGGAMLVSAVAGMAGIGKTELVLQTARRALDTPGWFPGGVLFVDLFGYDPARRLSAADALLGWLQAIGVPGEHIPAGEHDRARLWSSVLGAYVEQGRRLLLIIDNAADAAQVTPLLPADAGVPVLITSRHTLDIDARLHDLDVLDTDAAVDLVCEVIAHRRGPADSRVRDRQGMVELVELCAGLPLALRIVAALLADRPHLQPASLAGDLRDAQHRLDRLSREQVAVRAAFDLSYQRLTPQQARLFRLLPVNPGPDVGTTAAASLADVLPAEATVLLQDLHRAHLVDEPAAGRWRLHDLIRLYAGSQPPQSQDKADTARRRLFSHYQDTTRAAATHLDPISADDTRFATREHALAWLDAEHSNLIAVCGSAPGHQLPQISTNLAFALAHFLYFRRYFDDWITIAASAAEICRESGDRHGEGKALRNLGTALQEVGRFEEAITAHTQGLEICRELGDRHGEGRALNNLGLALAEVGRFEEAITAYTQDLEICQQLGDRHGEGKALANLGVALTEVGRFEEAITAHTQDLEICRQFGDRHGEGQTLGNLGIALRQVRRIEEARSCWIEAADAFTDADDAASAAVVRQWLDELPSSVDQN